MNGLQTHEGHHPGGGDEADIYHRDWSQFILSRTGNRVIEADAEGRMNQTRIWPPQS
jgi:hypothetical protein